MKKLIAIGNSPQKGIHLVLFGVPIPLLSIPTKASRAYARRLKGLTQDDIRYILECQFKASFGKLPDWEKPVGFNEKLTWEKLYYWNPIMSVCADKVRGRDYFLEKNPSASKYLVKQFGVYSSAEEVDFSVLPAQFILKSNWGSGCQMFVRDKSEMDERKVRRQVNKWMQPTANHYYFSLEWGYKDIPPRIICEEILEFEYKIEFFCFNGKPKFFWIVLDDKTSSVRANFYNLDWTQIPVRQKYRNFTDSFKKPKDADYEKMQEISQKLSAGFPFMRCDFYKTNDGFKFSEMTFYHWGATCKFEPDKYDKIFGDMMLLPPL